MGVIWVIIIGFVAGLIAKFLHPGSNEPAGFILTTVLGIVGAFVATWIGQAIGWYQPGEGAGLIGAVVGADHRAGDLEHGLPVADGAIKLTVQQKKPGSMPGFFMPKPAPAQRRLCAFAKTASQQRPPPK